MLKAIQKNKSILHFWLHKAKNDPRYGTVHAYGTLAINPTTYDLRRTKKDTAPTNSPLLVEDSLNFYFARIDDD